MRARHYSNLTKSERAGATERRRRKRFQILPAAAALPTEGTVSGKCISTRRRPSRIKTSGSAPPRPSPRRRPNPRATLRCVAPAAKEGEQSRSGGGGHRPPQPNYIPRGKTARDGRPSVHVSTRRRASRCGAFPGLVRPRRVGRSDSDPHQLGAHVSPPTASALPSLGRRHNL